MLRNYRDLKVWQKSFSACLRMYRVTGAFPADERFGLTAQLRRTSMSVPSNIAEGYGRKSIADYSRMLYIAYGSLCELETQMMLSNDLEFLVGVNVEDLNAKISEVERMLKSLIKALEKKN